MVRVFDRVNPGLLDRAAANSLNRALEMLETLAYPRGGDDVNVTSRPGGLLIRNPNDPPNTWIVIQGAPVSAGIFESFAEADVDLATGNWAPLDDGFSGSSTLQALVPDGWPDPPAGTVCPVAFAADDETLIILTPGGGGGTGTLTADNYNYTTGTVFGSAISGISYLRVDFEGTVDPLYANYGPLFITAGRSSITPPDPPNSAVLHVRACDAYASGGVYAGRPGVIVVGDQYVPGRKWFVDDMTCHQRPGTTGPLPGILWFSQARGPGGSVGPPAGSNACWVTGGAGETSVELHATDSLNRAGGLYASSGGITILGATGADGSGWPTITITHTGTGGGSTNGATSTGATTGGLQFQSGLFIGGAMGGGFTGTL